MSEQTVALVSGANKGIGFEVCRQLVTRRFQVFLTARSFEAGNKACRLLKDAGASVRFVELDVTSPESVQAAAEVVASHTRRLDVLVNNAGICEDPDRSIMDVTPDIFNRTLQTNTLGPLMLTQKLWPLLAKSKAARVINVSSGLGSLSDMSSGYPSYRMSKAALNALTRILAAELASKNVAVNSVSPGWVRTDMGGPGAPSSIQEGADTIVWLATEAPQSLTGQFIGDRKPMAW